MSPAHVLEPTYDALRRRLLTGTWPSGQRLEAVRLADELGVSITPVRDALNRLVGERLVQSTPGDGFHGPRLDEAEFRTLLGWHHMLLVTALRGRGRLQLIQIPRGHDGIGERTALLFGAIAAVAGSNELDWAMSNSAARLGPFRKHEEDTLPDVEQELDAIEQLARNAPREMMRRAIGHYHRRRIDRAAKLTSLARDGASTK